MIPQAGSAYTYAYATLGELVAWIIGWDLIIEYAVGNIAVAVSWSGYFQELLRGFGVAMPEWMATDYLTASHGAQQVRDAIASGVDPATLPAHVQQAAHAVENAPSLFGLPIIFNFPAFMYLSFVEKHSTHHRGQLSAYLRPMGSKVPSIYGGSADEPWQGAADSADAAAAAGE